MYIRGRQSEIGVQRSRHQVTSCNERARIDVEKSQGNEDDEMREKGGHDERKGTRERDEETLSHASRTQQWQSQVCYCESLVFRRLSTITGYLENEAACRRERTRRTDYSYL